MKINDVEKQLNIPKATIRFYEKEGFIKPQRKENGYREYSPDDLDHLMKIKLMRQLGISLDTIKESDICTMLARHTVKTFRV